jgi:hypothetical protein
VCAIDATKKGVGLRFLYGVLLDDPRGVLEASRALARPGQRRKPGARG